MTTFVIFSIASQRYGVPVEEVDAVLPMAWITRVADSPPDVCGLLDVRGTLVAVVDPALRLKAPLRPPSAKDFLVLVGQGAGAVALKVDEVAGVSSGEVRHSPPEVEAPPFVLGHLQLSGELVTILDVHQLLRPEVRELVAAMLQGGAA
ncbi:MAG: chemotaxis protein CheW [Myxococcaceae bacterium]